MERESFENPEIGKILSEHFVSIKVESGRERGREKEGRGREEQKEGGKERGEEGEEGGREGRKKGGSKGGREGPTLASLTSLCSPG